MRQVDVHDPVGNPICHPVASLQSSLGLQQDPNSTYMQAVNGAPLAACLQRNLPRVAVAGGRPRAL